MLLTQAVTCPSAWGAVLQGCRVSRCDLFVERCKAQASGAGTLLPPLALRPAAAPRVPLRRFVRRAPGAGSCARAGVWPLSFLASLPVPRAPCRFEISVSDSSQQPSA